MRVSRRLLVLGLAAAVLVPAPARGEINGAGWIVVDHASGAVLAESNADVARPPASLTKMITAQVVIERVRLDDILRISYAAANAEADRIRWPMGMQFSVADVLHGLLLESSNGAAIALAEHIAGSHKAFAALMNDKARRLGARASRFVNAHGLDAPGQVATPRDLAAIAGSLLREPVLADIVRSRSYKLTWQGGLTTFYNNTKFLSQYRGAIGIKPGYTTKAGNCLAAAAERGGSTIIAIVMSSTSVTEDASGLIDEAFSKLGATDRRVSDPGLRAEREGRPVTETTEVPEAAVVTHDEEPVAGIAKRKTLPDSRMPSPAGTAIVFFVAGFVTVKRTRARRY